MRLLRQVMFPLLFVCIPVVVSAAYAGSSDGFIENKGQVGSLVKYYCPGSRAAIYFTEDAVVVDLKEDTGNAQGRGPRAMLHDELAAEATEAARRRGCAVYIRFDGAANPSPAIEARGELVTRFNYFLGSDSSRWLSGVAAYDEVVYRDVWPGVDVAYRLAGGLLGYEVIASSDQAASQARFCYEGADRVAREADGSWVMETCVGSVRDALDPAGRSGKYTFTLGDVPDPGAREPAAPTDDPAVLLWSTFVGGSGQDAAYAVALDASGNPVLTGFTSSADDFPTTPGAYDVVYDGDDDIFVAKLSASGSTLLWSTFLGGAGCEEGYDLILDSEGSPILTGFTRSSDFPTTSGAYDRLYSDSTDAFVAKLSSSGDALTWSSFLGGGGYDSGRKLAGGASGNILICGSTHSSDFPTTPGAFDRSFGGFVDGFAAALSPSGSTLAWSSYLGGSDGDAILFVAPDASGDLVVTGNTGSTDFPVTPGAYDVTLNGYDAFVAKLAASGNSLLWASFLGGSSYDAAVSLALDPTGGPTVTGWTASPDFPTTQNAFDESYNGEEDGYAASLSADGSSLVWSSYLGGSDTERCMWLALDPSGNPIIAGYTGSSDFPTTPGAYDGSYNGDRGYGDVFVTRMSGAGEALGWSSFLGGPHDEVGYCLELDSLGNPVVCGYTDSRLFPATPGAYDTTASGLSMDVFVCNLDLTSLAGAPPAATSGRAASLCAVGPDPFRWSTTVQFFLPERQGVFVAVYDVRGRLARALVDAVAEPGMHQLQWDGRSGNETVVAPGIYFVHMEAGSYRAAKKIVLMK